jgi:transposase
MLNKKTENWGGVRHLSIDEMSQRQGHKDFVTVVADIDRHKLLEMLPSHKPEKIMETLVQQPLAVREQVEEVSVDMWGGFHISIAIVVAAVFPNAKIIIDRFHVMKPVNRELNQIWLRHASYRKQAKALDLFYSTN